MIPPYVQEGEGQAVLELTTERTQATFEELLEDYDYHRPQRGEYQEGTIVRMDGDEVIVDLGLKSEGIVPPQDIKRLDEELIEGLQVGDEIPVYILRPRSDRGPSTCVHQQGVREAGLGSGPRTPGERRCLRGSGRRA